MRGVFFIGALFLLCANVWANQLVRTLDVSVNVVVNSNSNELKIEAPRTDFLLVYLSSLSTFQPLDIPFTVSQSDGYSHNYTLRLAQLSGQCAVSGGIATPLTPLASLDGHDFDSSHDGSGRADPEQAHVLRLTFPNIPQASASRVCDGAVAVVAAVTI